MRLPRTPNSGAYGVDGTAECPCPNAGARPIREPALLYGACLPPESPSESNLIERPQYEAFEFYVSGDVPLNAYCNRILFVEPMLLLFLGVFVM